MSGHRPGGFEVELEPRPGARQPLLVSGAGGPPHPTSERHIARAGQADRGRRLERANDWLYAIGYVNAALLPTLQPSARAAYVILGENASGLLVTAAGTGVGPHAPRCGRGRTLASAHGAGLNGAPPMSPQGNAGPPSTGEQLGRTRGLWWADSGVIARHRHTGPRCRSFSTRHGGRIREVRWSAWSTRYPRPPRSDLAVPADERASRSLLGTDLPSLLHRWALVPGDQHRPMDSRGSILW